MSRKPSMFAFLAAALLMALVLVVAQGRPALAEQSPEERMTELGSTALSLVSAENGLSGESLAIDNSSVADFPYTGRTAYSYKIDDAVTGERYGMDLDEKGQPVDLEQWVAEEAAAYDAFYGGLDPMLAEYLLVSDPEELVPVIVWLHEPEYTPPDRPAIDSDAPELPEYAGPDDSDSEAVEAYHLLAESQRSEAVALVTAPAVDRLSALGVSVEADTLAPMLSAMLSTKQILEVAAWDEVDTVYLDGVAEPNLNVARATIYGTTVHYRGINGTGVRVAEIEVGGRVHSHPNLSGVVQDFTYSCLSWHSSHVAGIIRSTHGTNRGIAPNSLLRVGGSCTGNVSQILNRSTAARSWGARVFNLSFGRDTNRVPSTEDRYYDNLVRNNARSVIVAAGNRGASGCFQGTDGDVISPGLAYNVVTVGNFDDKGTTSWSGDSMASCSSWRDPISSHNDREKPEVAAPGTSIRSIVSNTSFGNASGTSMASPMVAGGAALLVDRRSALGSWPESVKAILMASAIHNIEGYSRLSEKDGAGGIELRRADNIARRYRSNWGGISYNCVRPTTVNLSSMNLVAGKLTRAVIAWDTTTSYSSYNTRPSADLDLRVRAPNGSIVASSSSWDNTYEIVRFTPTVSGTYTLQVYKYRCSANPGYLGWAWTRNS